MLKVLFVCVHNSARSQITEELLRLKFRDQIHVESAGLEPCEINPIVVDVLKTKGIDITGKKTKNVFDLIKQGSVFDYVITVCDDTSGESCPTFPGVINRIHWSFPDLSSFTGNYKEKHLQIISLTKMIEDKIDDFCTYLKSIDS